MTFAKTPSLLTAAAVAAMAVAPIAGAQQAAPAAPVAKVTGSYLYIQKLATVRSGHTVSAPYATLVFKTDRQLPRRHDGLIRAGASIAGGGSSMRSVDGHGSRCYTVMTPIRPDNTIVGNRDGTEFHTKARAGSRLPVTITPGSGTTVAKRTLTLRKARLGDPSGKPLGC